MYQIDATELGMVVDKRTDIEIDCRWHQKHNQRHYTNYKKYIILDIQGDQQNKNILNSPAQEYKRKKFIEQQITSCIGKKLHRESKQ